MPGAGDDDRRPMGPARAYPPEIGPGNYQQTTMHINIATGEAEENVGTVVLGFGPQPMDWLSKASKVAGKGAVMDPDVARMAGANLAAGQPKALAALRARLEAGAIECAMNEAPALSTAAARWLAAGERGTSSNTMFTHLTGFNALRSDHKCHPYDPDDLRRCLLLLEKVPELQPLFPRMAEVSPTWAALVAVWDKLRETMDAESPEWRRGRGAAPKTYKLMQAALGR